MPNYSGWPESPREEGVPGRNLGSASSQSLSFVLCSRHRVRLEGNRGSHWTKGVEKVVSGWSGQEEKEGVEGGLGRGQGAGDEAEDGPQRAGFMAAHGGHTDPEASALAVRP